VYGINLEEVIKYLENKKVINFMKKITKKYKLNNDNRNEEYGDCGRMWKNISKIRYPR
jgi:hypothetical protein